MSKPSPTAILTAAFLLSCGIAASGYFVGQTLANGKRGDNLAEVKGLAERRVSADHAYWRIDYGVGHSGVADLPRLYADSEAAQAKILKLLADNGFDRDEIRPGVAEYRRSELRDNDQKLIEERHRLSASIEIDTAKVRKVAEVRIRLNQLIAEGIDLSNNAPSYQFTALNQNKPEMLQEATRNARSAAAEFARNAGVEVGAIKSASQGGFSIRDAGDDSSDSRCIDKDVRVVTSISFYLGK